MPEVPLLAARDLRAGYDGQEVLHGLQLEVHAHEKLCVLGPNGCGKTTLLRALAGLLPFDGQVELFTLEGPLDVRRARRRDIGRVLALMSQRAGVLFPYTVEETVTLGRYPHSRALGGLGAADRRAVEEALRRTGLWELRRRSVTQLSGGQLQRVFLARTFAQDPAVILLDEPTNHLDLGYQLELMDYLRSWAAEGRRCVVGVLHDIGLALSFADTVLLLQDGRAAACCPAEQLPDAALNDAFGLDVGAHMRRMLARWQAPPA